MLKFLNRVRNMRIGIDYLTCLLEYLEENSCKAILSLVYGKDKFFKPCNCESYKAFFLNILLSELFPIKYDKETYQDLLASKREFEDAPEEDKDAPYYIANSYNCYRTIFEEQGEWFNGEDEDIDTILELLEDYYLPTENTAKILLEYLECIMNSIHSFSVEITPESNKKKYKLFLNKAIQQICSDKFCFQIYNKFLNFINLNPISLEKANIISKTYQLKEENKCLLLGDEELDIFVKIPNYTKFQNYKYRNNENSAHVLVGCKSIEKYFNTIKSLKIAIEELPKCIENRNCHICYPIIKNSSGKKTHKCATCAKIFEIIKKIDKSNPNNKYICEKIKGNLKNKNLTFEETRKLHYKRLLSYVKELNIEQYTNEYSEFEKLVNIAFANVNL